MADESRPGIFPTFFLSGFECSTFIWKDQGRRDLVAETRHREHAKEDYQLLRDVGIAVAREGIPWPLVEKRGYYDFSALDPLIDAINRTRILPIWDLCHYGYPIDADPLHPDFAERFARYCGAAAEYVIPRVHLPGPHFFTPINEITFFAFMGGQWGWVAPALQGDEQRFALRRALCRAAIAGAQAIRAVEPTARMVNIDPLVNVVAPRGRPDLEEAAHHETYEDTFVAWDILAGRQCPEYGGHPEILDIVGVNCYSFGQMEYRPGGPHASLDPGDDRIKPLCDLLMLPWERYGRPMIIGETSGLREGRDEWLDDVMQESLAAIDRGIDLHGVCLFPAVDMPDWHTGEWLHSGIVDLAADGDDLRRVPAASYVARLRDWQRRLNRVTMLDADPFDNPVDLRDVIRAARELRQQPDKNWS
ncbi:MAG TPA: hypothetical protein VIL85_09640 [Thermomicrobiales bacterium]|jgi:beta-glucosidase/6-phospho-beta-glucosidase/beta-galactosidase